MLNLDPWTVLWTGINLVVLYLLMRHFLFKPVTAMMEQRTKAIEDGLSQAEAAKQAAQALDQENEARLAQVRGQADQIVAQAKLQGQREYDQIISSAQADAQAIRADAQAQMEAERRQMLQDAQQQVAALALLAAAKVSGRAMDQAGDRDLVEDFLREAGDLWWESWRTAMPRHSWRPGATELSWRAAPGSWRRSLFCGRPSAAPL